MHLLVELELFSREVGELAQAVDHDHANLSRLPFWCPKQRRSKTILGGGEVCGHG